MRQGRSTPEPTPLHTLAQQVKRLEDEVGRLKNNRGPTIPLYDPDNFPLGNVEGQIALGHPDSAWAKTAWAYDDDNNWWQIGGDTPTISSMVVIVGWGATSGYYTFPSNGDGISDGGTAIYGMPDESFRGIFNCSLTYQALGGADIIFHAANFDTVSHDVSQVVCVVQDLASSTRQHIANASAQTIVGGAGFTDLSLQSSPAVGTLIDTTTTPATWVSSGRYAMHLSFAA